MARMRAVKQQLKDLLSAPDWRDHLPELRSMGQPAVGPLFSFLLLEPLMRHKAALALGQVVAGLEEGSAEDMHNIMRRLMWHMNEESGNIGWGIPEAFGEVLAACPRAAKEFHRVLISYVIDLGRDDNFCDHGPLRRSCFWAIGRLAQARQELADIARPWLLKGLEDEDIPCRGMAAWALAQLPRDFMDAPALRRLAEAGHEDICEVFDGEKVVEKTVSELAREALG